MAFTCHCPCGKRFRIQEYQPRAAVRCPACGSVRHLPATAPSCESSGGGRIGAIVLAASLAAFLGLLVLGALAFRRPVAEVGDRQSRGESPLSPGSQASSAGGWAGRRGAEPVPGKNFALLVGINKYDHEKLKQLRYAENDARELGLLLEKAGYAVTLLSSAAEEGRRPTLANIQARLAEVLEKCKRHDTILVALAGHGLQFEKKAAGDPDDAYFCPQDAKPLPERRDTLLSLAGLYKQLDDSGAGVKLLLVDACRDDPTAARGGRRGVDGSRSPRPPRGVAALFSCSAGESAYEVEKLEHGVFFHYVLEGLRGKAASEGEVTWDGLHPYVRRRVSRDVGGLVGGGVRQTPALNAGELAGESPILLTLRDTRAVPPAAPTPEPPPPSPLKPVTQPEPEPLPVVKFNGPPPPPLDCRASYGPGKVRAAQEAWAKYLGRKVEEIVEVADRVPMTFVLIPPGKFLMGSPKDESYRELENVDETLHEVTLTEPFYLGKTEVTQAQYTALEVANPSQFPGPDLPVERVSWLEARDWAEQLTRKCADGYCYRLPTEAEWEYSCRGGRPCGSAFGVGDGQVFTSLLANFKGTEPCGCKDPGPWKMGTCPVACRSYPANGFGLYDMHGNVWEWCHDAYAPYPREAVTDPTGPEQELPRRVLRGGGWGAGGPACRAAFRKPVNCQNNSLNDVGFRLVRALAFPRK